MFVNSQRLFLHDNDGFPEIMQKPLNDSCNCLKSAKIEQMFYCPAFVKVVSLLNN